jgi:cell division protein FtsL
MRQPLTVGVFVAATLASAVGVVQAKHKNRALQNDLQQLRVEQDRLDTEWAQLQLEESAWANHGRIEQIARKRLGMRDPENYSVIMRR